MAVYTQVKEEELDRFLAAYDLGELHSFIGIVDGVSNSNFLLETDKGRYILTLFEELVDSDSIPYFLTLMKHLAEGGIACPTPVAARDGLLVRPLSHRPAVIVSFMTGRSLKKFVPDHCRQTGAVLAEFHHIGARFDQTRPNSIGLPAWQYLFARVKDRADTVASGLADTITKELHYLSENWPSHLPRGAIHGDLFPDNVFFQKDSLSGIIDFHFACTDLYVYDLAISMNAWCFEQPNDFNITKARAMLDGYQSRRALNDDEKKYLPFMLRASAMRFLIRRLYDWLNVPEGALVKPHDPMVYARRLSFHQQMKDLDAYGLLR